MNKVVPDDMKKFIVAISLSVFLVGCSSGMKSALGLKQRTPDEFTVLSYPHLSVPPDFQLTDPSKENIHQHQKHSEQAGKPHAYSSEEKMLMQRVSDQQEKDAIAAHVDKEEVSASEPVRKSIFPFKLFNTKAKDPSIDPEEEKERITTNLKEGKAVNEGETAKAESKSTLQRIFGY